ncbi:MAG: hypothetical protein WAT09_15290 [Paracoccaceae bacterium]
MSIEWKSVFGATLVAAALALVAGTVPATAQTMSGLLPTLTWPDDTVTPSTKGCAPDTKAVCVLQE